jgi:mannose-1-phosphate guanylyltransferase
MKVYSVILAGGSGTRFWPLSRAAWPKQFLKLGSDAPLLLDTIRRLSTPLSQTVIVCGPTHAPKVRQMLKRLPKANLIVEPIARNTAPAVGLAAIQIASKDPSAILQVLPSDHAIRDVERFRSCLREAAQLASQGHLVTLGIKPTRPETGYGYIELGQSLGADSWTVQAFVEKPDAARAQQYLESGKFVWNGGIFIFRAQAILDAYRQHMPELAEKLSTLAASIGKRDYAARAKRVFKGLPSISIDYGVMEKANNLAVVRGEFGWSDLGSFASVAEVRSPDAEGNVVVAPNAQLVECRDCIVFGGSRALALVGLSGLVVVDTQDVLLMVPKKESQAVRKAVQAFQQRRLRRYL